MAKAGELNWDELHKSTSDYKHTPSALWINDPSTGVAPKGEARPLLAKGEVPIPPSDEDIRAEIMRGMDQPGLRQPTDEELFGHLVVSEEQVEAAKAEFDNRMNSTIEKLHTPLTGKTFEEDEAWGTGTSFNSTLSKSELAKRNMYLGDD